MTMLYFLCTNHEYGPEDISATLDPAKLPDMVRRYFPPGQIRQEALTRLEGVVERERPITLHLEDGWGGLALHIIALDEPISQRNMP